MILFIYNSGKCKLVYLDEKITCRGGGAGGRVQGRGQTMFTILTMILSWVYTCQHVDFPGSSDGKESACKAGDQGWIPGSGRSLGEGNGNPLQYSCLENFMDRRAWQATVQESQRVGLDWVTNTHTYPAVHLNYVPFIIWQLYPRIWC